MGKRLASSKATRGVSKARRPVSSSSSNPKNHKFRSQYNSLAVIAKGGPSRKCLNKEAVTKIAKEATERKNFLTSLDSICLIDKDDDKSNKESTRTESNSKKLTKRKSNNSDQVSQASDGSKFTTASFASVWSNCTNASLNEFFQVWNPKLVTHKDALAVVAGLSQILSSKGIDQTDMQLSDSILKLISSPDTPTHILTGALLILTFLIRKLPDDEINTNFDRFYSVLKEVMEKYHESKKKSLSKSLVRCFASLTKAHPLGKEAIERNLRKKINLLIRRHKVQNKIQL